MSLLVVCPLGAQIADVVLDDCPSDVGQIQKLIFQRVFSTGTTRNTISAANSTILGTWTTILTAVDGTKAQITPWVSAPENEPGERLTYGGGNDTVNGIPLTVGLDPSSFTCKLIRAHAKTANSLKGLYGETIGVWLVNEHGRIWGASDDAETPTTYYPIPIRELFVSDRKLGGFLEPDYYMLSFQLEPNWSDTLNEIIPNFDPLTALAN